ncbi:hypothetical protein C1H46_023427 [Malus baccata]|uniref:Uncharacterized protein n=1 Tax=Malus baccata TaxID=106549 RepID=A0A540LXD6_MALBA|nr:hypothetical protein C1H46_023427 [Malus baccata]
MSFHPPSYGGSKPIKNINFPKPISPFHRYFHSTQAQVVDSEDSEQEEERVQSEKAEVRWYKIEGLCVGLSRCKKECKEKELRVFERVRKCRGKRRHRDKGNGVWALRPHKILT